MTSLRGPRSGGIPAVPRAQGKPEPAPGAEADTLLRRIGVRAILRGPLPSMVMRVRPFRKTRTSGDRRADGAFFPERRDGTFGGAGDSGSSWIALPGGFPEHRRSTGCAANFRQLSRGWLLYAEDHGGRPGNLDGGDVLDPRGTNRNWADRLDSGSPSPQNTNTALLRDAPDRTLRGVGGGLPDAPRTLRSAGGGPGNPGCGRCR